VVAEYIIPRSTASAENPSSTERRMANVTITYPWFFMLVIPVQTERQSGSSCCGGLLLLFWRSARRLVIGLRTISALNRCVLLLDTGLGLSVELFVIQKRFRESGTLGHLPRF